MPRSKSTSPKVCVTCKQLLPREEFDPVLTPTGAPNGVWRSCRACHSKVIARRVEIRDYEQNAPPPTNGLCQCGCGERTAIASHTQPRFGWIAGEPKQFIIGHRARKSSVEYIVIDRGFETPCWEWQRARTNSGYGKTWVTGRCRPAHVVAYEKINGPVPPGHELHHRCENKACVNLSHIVLLTVSRHRSVTAYAQRRLTREQVDEIRAIGTSIKARDLAARYNVSEAAIHHIIERNTYMKWEHD